MRRKYNVSPKRVAKVRKRVTKTVGMVKDRLRTGPANPADGLGYQGHGGPISTAGLGTKKKTTRKKKPTRGVMQGTAPTGGEVKKKRVSKKTSHGRRGKYTPKFV